MRRLITEYLSWAIEAAATLYSQAVYIHVVIEHTMSEIDRFLPPKGAFYWQKKIEYM